MYLYSSILVWKNIRQKRINIYTGVSRELPSMSTVVDRSGNTLLYTPWRYSHNTPYVQTTSYISLLYTATAGIIVIYTQRITTSYIQLWYSAAASIIVILYTAVAAWPRQVTIDADNRSQWQRSNHSNSIHVCTIFFKLIWNRV